MSKLTESMDKLVSLLASIASLGVPTDILRAAGAFGSFEGNCCLYVLLFACTISLEARIDADIFLEQTVAYNPDHRHDEAQFAASSLPRNPISH